MDGKPSHDEIRSLVRALLREAMASGRGGAEADTERTAPAGDGGGLSEQVRHALKNGAPIEVSIAGDIDLNGFAQQVALCALERELLGAIASNRVRFRLAQAGRSEPRAAPPGPVATNPRDGDGAYRLESGLLSESKVAEIAKSHDRLVLGPGAVLTPLARDRARRLRLQIVRQGS